jgi:Sulfotransferase family
VAARRRSRLPASRADPSLVFVGGLHRSGTSLLTNVLGTHPAIATLRATGVPEEEGQHLQKVYPTARALGGPGRFASSAGAHLTERSPGADTASARSLLAAWTPFWDPTRPIRVEKSPPNLLRTRFLQALFPDARFLIVMRHPGIVALSTQKWARGASVADLVAHWEQAHALFWRDRAHLRSVMVVRYETFVRDAAAVMRDVARLLGVDDRFDVAEVDARRSAVYERAWKTLYDADPATWRAYEEPVAALGYRLGDASGGG